MINHLASLVVQIAPFVSIIIVELFRPGFQKHLEGALKEYDEVTLFDEREKTDINRFATYSFDFQNTIDHLELTLLSLVVVFIGKIITAEPGRTLILTGVIFVVSALAMVAVRYKTESYFDTFSPDRYWVEGFIAGHRAGKLAVVGSNLFIILLIFISDLL